MPLEQERARMYDYYVLSGAADRAAVAFKEKIYALLDEYDRKNPGLTGYQLKAAQYRAISENITPILFDGIPFYFEMGTLDPYSDGCRNRGSTDAANGWVSQRNAHLLGDALPDVNRRYTKDCREKLYLGYPGRFFDEEHFTMPLKKIFSVGVKGVLDEAMAALSQSETAEQRQFVQSAAESLLAYRRMADAFAQAALEKMKRAEDAREREMLRVMAETALHVPWNPPQTVYEGLCAMAFLRKAIGSIEGVGFNTFGRADVLLWPLYEADRERGVPREKIYDLICKFILIWDCHVDRRRKMSGYAEYEYENSLTLGGCDENGCEVYNEITRMFLQAHMALSSMYPKIKCRYSKKSSPEYLAAIAEPILHQQSILLYVNDDAVIPSMIRFGITREHAMDYIISGCWGINSNDNYKRQVGYLNTLRAMEWAMTATPEKLREMEMEDFRRLDAADSFEDVYEKVLENILLFVRRKAAAEAEGLKRWGDAVPMCAYSALLNDPLRRRRDFTAGGGRYNWDSFNLAALPDTIDSLLAIQRLCFDEKACTLAEMIDQCRNNWPNEALRQRAMAGPGYGDGREAPARLAARLLDDIYQHTRNLPTSFGGQWQISCYMYTEIIWWGREMGATPNGRHSGDYLTQGLTPSRLHPIQSVTDVFTSLRYVDMTKLAGGSVINVVLPHTAAMPQVLDAFFRGSASAMVHVMQVNCVSRDDLLAAQKEPEKYGHIIVRVCGFSAPFVMLSEEFQKEFLSRNYYEN